MTDGPDHSRAAERKRSGEGLQGFRGFATLDDSRDTIRDSCHLRLKLRQNGQITPSTEHTGDFTATIQTVNKTPPIKPFTRTAAIGAALHNSSCYYAIHRITHYRRMLRTRFSQSPHQLPIGFERSALYLAAPRRRADSYILRTVKTMPLHTNCV